MFIGQPAEERGMGATAMLEDGLFKKFPKKKYHRRSIIESMFFRVKRLCGNVVRAKKWVMQKKEMLGKILAYNIHRLVQLLRV